MLGRVFAFSNIPLLLLYSSIDPVILNTNSLLRRLIRAHPWLYRQMNMERRMGEGKWHVKITTINVATNAIHHDYYFVNTHRERERNREYIHQQQLSQYYFWMSRLWGVNPLVVFPFTFSILHSFFLFFILVLLRAQIYLVPLFLWDFIEQWNEFYFRNRFSLSFVLFFFDGDAADDVEQVSLSVCVEDIFVDAIKKNRSALNFFS